MVATAYLLLKKNQPGDMIVNDIVAMIFNDDSAQTAAQTIATACAQLRTDGHPIVGDVYFDERQDIAALYNADNERIVFTRRGYIQNAA